MDFLKNNIYLVNYVAVLGLSCSLQDTLVAACELLVVICRVLVLLPGIKPMLPALGVQSLSHWTNRGKSPCVDFGACGKVGIPGTDTLWIPRFSCTWQKGFM